MPGRSVAINLDALIANRYFEVGFGAVVLSEIVHAETDHTYKKCAHQEIQKAVRIRV